ncbi:hypothetical protein [Variovorax guangxiensis]|uniref:hypothetical protein n=1 Tax=Variovorax guangxiensis TaxID=1775474 RepID=UPI00286198C0|nr:hypothetical protein [Variovorax guangxiensis]MDR6859822.1 hypothetical protein [Variovorax guangxiensis]
MRSLLTFVAACVVLIGCATPTSKAPLPPDVKIEAPSAALPENVKGLSGKWVGQWINSRTRMDHVLIVESVDASSATAIYSIGEPSDSFTNIQPSWRRVKATVGPGTLEFSFPNGAAVNYKLQADGTLAGTYKSRGFDTTAKMTRTPV